MGFIYCQELLVWWDHWKSFLSPTITYTNTARNSKTNGTCCQCPFKVKAIPWWTYIRLAAQNSQQSCSLCIYGFAHARHMLSSSPSWYPILWMRDCVSEKLNNLFQSLILMKPYPWLHIGLSGLVTTLLLPRCFLYLHMGLPTSTCRPLLSPQLSFLSFF